MADHPSRISEQEKKKLKALLRNAADLFIDMRHWQYLCRLGRRTNRDVSEVLRGLLEKVFTDLRMINDDDDMMDRPLRMIRIRIDRFRLQPERLNKLLGKRAAELVWLAELFPHEVDRGTADLISRLRDHLYPPEQSSPVKTRLDTTLDDRIEELARALEPPKRKRWECEDRVRREKK